MNEHALPIEAESSNDLGGWTPDTQFVHIMGSLETPRPPAEPHAGERQEQE